MSANPKGLIGRRIIPYVDRRKATLNTVKISVRDTPDRKVLFSLNRQSNPWVAPMTRYPNRIDHVTKPCFRFRLLPLNGLTATS